MNDLAVTEFFFFYHVIPVLEAGELCCPATALIWLGCGEEPYLEDKNTVVL